MSDQRGKKFSKGLALSPRVPSSKFQAIVRYGNNENFKEMSGGRRYHPSEVDSGRPPERE